MGCLNSAPGWLYSIRICEHFWFHDWWLLSASTQHPHSLITHDKPGLAVPFKADGAHVPSEQQHQDSNFNPASRLHTPLDFIGTLWFQQLQLVDGNME